MDNYCEQLVQKKNTKNDLIKLSGISALILFATLVCIFFVIAGLTFLLAVAAGLVALDIWLISNMGTEYEYIVTNNEMDIDKIIGKKKRKRMITVDLAHASDFGRCCINNDIDAQTTVHASAGIEKDAYYLLVQHSDYGLVKVIFSPNEKLMEAIVHEFPRDLRARIRNDVQ